MDSLAFEDLPKENGEPGKVVAKAVTLPNVPEVEEHAAEGRSKKRAKRSKPAKGKEFLDVLEAAPLQQPTEVSRLELTRNMLPILLSWSIVSSRLLLYPKTDGPQVDASGNGEAAPAKRSRKKKVKVEVKAEPGTKAAAGVISNPEASNADAKTLDEAALVAAPKRQRKRRQADPNAPPPFGRRALTAQITATIKQDVLSGITWAQES